MIVGEATGGAESVMQAAPFAFGCLNAAVLDDELTRAGLLEVATPNVDRTLTPNPKPYLSPSPSCLSSFDLQLYGTCTRSESRSSASVLCMF